MRRGAITGTAVIVASPLLAGTTRAPLAEPSEVVPTEIVLGVDLSYVNEIEDCGATYRDGDLDDPFAILAARGANLVRARLWHDPAWTDYSTIDDVIGTFERARDHGMRTLLDFHYSDEWADPARQNTPAAWSAISEVDDLADALGAYTVDTLERLDAAGVLPDVVQVGNEINSGIVNGAVGLDWDHDLALFRAGIAAVRSVAASTGRPIDVMLHVAQPENGLWWFEEAAAVGLTDFDVIGLSYYPQWSRFTLEELGSTVQVLSTTYGKDVIVVETGYPWTRETSGDTADNVLDESLRAYDVSPAGQAAFMADLTSTVVANGGSGTVYWEPAWLSTVCRTRWGQGSHWENATLFDFDGRLHAGADYLARDYHPLTLTGGASMAAMDVTGDTEQDSADLIEVAAVAADGQGAITATIAGDVRTWPGSVLVAIDGVPDAGGDGGRRPYDFAPGERPELLLETSWHDDPGAGYVTTSLVTWLDGEWQPRTFTGRVAVTPLADGSTTVEWVVPAGVIEPGARLAVMTARRGRAGALADIVGPGTPDGPVAMALDLGNES